MEINKDKSIIPDGPYCYRPLGIVPDAGPFGFVYKVVPCPYYKRKDFGGVEQPYCQFLEKGGTENDLSDEQYQKLLIHFGNEEKLEEELPLSLLWDQVKECGINDFNEGDLQ